MAVGDVDPPAARIFSPQTREADDRGRGPRVSIMLGPNATVCMLNQWPSNRQSGVFGFCCKDISYKNEKKPISSGFDEVVLDGKADQFGVVAQVEFLEQARTVGVHRLDAEAVGLGYLAVGVAHGQAPQNLEFTHGK